MTNAKITQAQDKGLRHQSTGLFQAVRAFAVELYAAHGGWLMHSARTSSPVAARASAR